MQQLKNPLTCTLCNTVFDPMAQAAPSCSHTDAEWEAHWAAVGNRQRWHTVANPGVPPSDEVKEALAKLNAAPQ